MANKEYLVSLVHNSSDYSVDEYVEILQELIDGARSRDFDRNHGYKLKWEMSHKLFSFLLDKCDYHSFMTLDFTYNKNKIMGIDVEFLDDEYFERNNVERIRLIATKHYGSCIEPSRLQLSSKPEPTAPKIKNVMFNQPYTIVFWEDNTKTIVKCQPGDRYNAEKGLAMAFMKKTLGNTNKWYDEVKKWLPAEEEFWVDEKFLRRDKE